MEKSNWRIIESGGGVCGEKGWCVGEGGGRMVGRVMIDEGFICGW